LFFISAQGLFRRICHPTDWLVNTFFQRLDDGKNKAREYKKDPNYPFHTDNGCCFDERTKIVGLLMSEFDTPYADTEDFLFWTSEIFNWNTEATIYEQLKPQDPFAAYEDKYHPASVKTGKWVEWYCYVTFSTSRVYGDSWDAYWATYMIPSLTKYEMPIFSWSSLYSLLRKVSVGGGWVTTRTLKVTKGECSGKKEKCNVCKDKTLCALSKYNCCGKEKGKALVKNPNYLKYWGIPWGPDEGNALWNGDTCAFIIEYWEEWVGLLVDSNGRNTGMYSITQNFLDINIDELKWTRIMVLRAFIEQPLNHPNRKSEWCGDDRIYQYSKVTNYDPYDKTYPWKKQASLYTRVGPSISTDKGKASYESWFITLIEKLHLVIMNVKNCKPNIKTYYANGGSDLRIDGDFDGDPVGIVVGALVGAFVGTSVGARVGSSDGP